MNIGEIIGVNLRNLRKDRNLTLGQLSKISGISKAMLSEIEKGTSNPTINTLWKLANGLNVPYTRLMKEIEEASVIIKKSDISVQADNNEHYRIYCYFKSNTVRNFELFYVELDGGYSKSSVGHPANAEEYIYVINGELILQTEEKEHVLSEGDAIAFDSSVQHTYINKKNETATFIVINFYLN